jgi:hypothetical protein
MWQLFDVQKVGVSKNPHVATFLAFCMEKKESFLQAQGIIMPPKRRNVTFELHPEKNEAFLLHNGLD